MHKYNYKTNLIFAGKYWSTRIFGEMEYFDCEMFWLIQG